MKLTNHISASTIKQYQDNYGIKPRNGSKETAYILGVHPDTLRKSRCTGTLFGVPAPRHIKIGYTVQYTLEDLITWLEESNKNEAEAA